MSVAELEPIENQAAAPGAGDVDDCFAIALRRAMRQSGLPAASIAEIRAAAGVPDRPDQPDGATPSQVYGAARELARPAQPLFVKGFANLVDSLGHGKTAVIFYHAGRLPDAYRYGGFTGDHAGGLDLVGGALYISDPLARDGSAPKVISPSALRSAMEAFPNGTTAIVLTEVPMSVYRWLDKPGAFVIKANTSVRGYKPYGPRWIVEKTWEPRPNDSGAAFDARLLRMSGVITPSSLLHVLDGFFAGLYVNTAEVIETYDPPKTSIVTLAVNGEVKATVEI